MTFTYIRVTRTYELADDIPATGSVRFRPIDRMVNGLTVVSAPVTATLSGSGAIDITLAATTDSATRPIGVTYEVREQITGQTPVTYYVSVPHTAPAGTVDLSTLSVISPVDLGAFNLVDAGDYDDTTPPADGNAIVWNATASKWHPAAGAAAGVTTINGESPDGAGNIVISPSDVGAQPIDADLTGLGGLGDGYPKRAAGAWAAQTASQLATDLGVSNTTPVTLTASGGVITPNASAGWYFQHTAAANVTLAVPTGGTSGQLVVVDVFASAADRVLTFPAGTSPSTVTITSGTWHPVGLRNRSGTWFVVDPEAGVGVSGGGGGTPADGSVTNVKVSNTAAISADKLADGTANKIMTAAERTKLAGIATGANVAYATVQDEGTARTARTTINFTGAGVTATDDSVNGRTLITIPGGGGLSAGIPNVKDYGATGNGITDDTSAIAAAFAVNGSIFFPPGNYVYTGTGLFSATGVAIYGSGIDSTNISLGAGKVLVAGSSSIYSLTLKDFTTDGGAGAVNLTYTGTNVIHQYLVEDCFFYNYTGTALGHTSSDMPYWRIVRCGFRAANNTAAIGVALSGLTDLSEIVGCWFLNNRVHVKLAQGGNNMKILNSDFIHFDAITAGNPRTSIWVVPNPGSDATNSGQGCHIRSNKFGNENMDASDFRILYADAAAGSFLTALPNTGATSTGWIGGHIVNDNYVNGSVANVPFVYTTTGNIIGCDFGPNTFGGFSPDYILKYRTAITGSGDNARNWFGPNRAGLFDFVAAGFVANTNSTTVGYVRGDRTTVTGSKGGNAALTSVIAALVKHGIVIDSTT